MNLFKKKKYVPIKNQPGTKDGGEPARAGVPVIPDGLWMKCPCCRKTIYVRETGRYKLCPQCGGCLRLSYRERLEVSVDEGSFRELDAGMKPGNPLKYPGYQAKLDGLTGKTGLNEAIVTGECSIKDVRCVVGIMDSNFIMGSMGSVVGEKLTRAFEYAAAEALPVVVLTASGGARMQEGIISLMQMAKVSAAVKRHSDRGLLYITVLTDPTTGGVTASFAMLGDIILAEPGALVGFAGRRVIEQTIRQRLPEGFQTAEFLLEHGFVDRIAERAETRELLGDLLLLHSPEHSAGVPRNPGGEVAAHE